MVGLGHVACHHEAVHLFGRQQDTKEVDRFSRPIGISFLGKKSVIYTKMHCGYGPMCSFGIKHLLFLENFESLKNLLLLDFRVCWSIITANNITLKNVI